MPKPNTPSTKPKADIDFENDLWNTAKELRGVVTEKQQLGNSFSTRRTTIKHKCAGTRLCAGS